MMRQNGKYISDNNKKQQKNIKKTYGFFCLIKFESKYI